ncbi:MAG: metallophosphoesterase [Bacteroidetes bacterium]|nr:metallophosphoesterase [Bacteroidota bacterium]MBU1579924.1 metallophosphoesterase [Bacteroidota bacterium]MBU2465830.1 metallophosphoesterase [Bacteroidota bacterium]MBU2556600.1 metallophosphoesterase [Bacteroidota bacterium]
MKSKNWYIVLSVSIFIIAGIVLTWLIFPKNLVRYPFFIGLLLLDYYLWTKVRSRVFTYHKGLKIVIGLLYWSPLIALSLSMIVNLFVPQQHWNQLFRTYLYGSIFAVYIGKIIPAVFLLIFDLFRLIWQLIQAIFRKNPQAASASNNKMVLSRRKFVGNMALASGGLIIGTMFTGMFKWVHQFSIREHAIRFKGLASDSFNGYRIAQLSDMHLGGWANADALQEAVDEVLAMKPDLIVFTGDLVNYRSEEAFRFKEILKQLKAKDGVYAILGNHDYGDYVNWPSKKDKQENLSALFSFYHEIGWKLLRNEHVILEKGTDKLALIGVENWSKNNRFPRYGNILKASKGIGQVQGKILLSHDPSHWKSIVLPEHADIDIMLAGHTHGFQFGIEIPGIKWSPAQYMYEEWAGMYTATQSTQKLYVNRGIGSIGYPGRIGILPEITLLTINT